MVLACLVPQNILGRIELVLILLLHLWWRRLELRVLVVTLRELILLLHLGRDLLRGRSCTVRLLKFVIEVDGLKVVTAVPILKRAIHVLRRGH